MPLDIIRSQPIDEVRVYVIHHPSYPDGESISGGIANHLESLSTPLGDRSIETRVLCEAANPLDEEGPPEFIDINASVFSVAILLADRCLTGALQGPWSSFRDAFVDGIWLEGEHTQEASILPLIVAVDRDALFPLGTDEPVPTWAREIQAERAFDWPHSVREERSVARILLHTYRLMLNGLDATQPEHSRPLGPTRRTVFLSHAKADVDGVQADQIAVVESLRRRMNNSNFGLDPFFDTTHALPGNPWRRQFSQAINTGSLIAVGTDGFASSATCQWELLQAKRARRPILNINAVRRRELRSFPYGGNLPCSRVDHLDEDNADGLLLDLMSEMVRMELWLREAKWVTSKAGIQDAVLLPRQAELVDMAFHVLKNRSEGKASDAPGVLIYPDPPLPPDLYSLIGALKPDNLDVIPLSDLRAKL